MHEEAKTDAASSVGEDAGPSPRPGPGEDGGDGAPPDSPGASEGEAPLDAPCGTRCGPLDVCNPGAGRCEPACDSLGGLDPLSPWPIVSGCLTNRGLSRYTGSSSGEVKWETDLTCWPGYPGSASPTIGRDGTLYLTGGCGSSLVAFHPDGTTAFWGPTSFRAPTVAADGTLWLGSREGLFHLRPSGTLLGWNGDVYVSDSSPPYVHSPDAIIMLGSVLDSAGYFSRSSVVHFDGQITVDWWWDVPERGSGGEGIAVGGDGAIYDCSSEGALTALEPDGGVRWVVALGECLAPTVGPDGTVYVGDGRGISAISAAGEVLWAASLGSGRPMAQFISIAPDGTLIASAAYEGAGIYAVSPQGSVLWNVPSILPYNDGGRVVIDRSGQIYAGFADGVRSIRPDGTVAWFHADADGCSSPVIAADGTTYASCGSRLVALAP